MSGLNPSGLGNEEDFESVDTEQTSIGPNGERTIQYDSDLGSLVVTE